MIDASEHLNTLPVKFRMKRNDVVHEVVLDPFGEGPLFRVRSWRIVMNGETNLYLEDVAWTADGQRRVKRDEVILYPTVEDAWHYNRENIARVLAGLTHKVAHAMADVICKPASRPTANPEPEPTPLKAVEDPTPLKAVEDPTRWPIKRSTEDPSKWVVYLKDGQAIWDESGNATLFDAACAWDALADREPAAPFHEDNRTYYKFPGAGTVLSDSPHPVPDRLNVWYAVDEHGTSIPIPGWDVPYFFSPAGAAKALLVWAELKGRDARVLADGFYRYRLPEWKPTQWEVVEIRGGYITYSYGGSLKKRPLLDYSSTIEFVRDPYWHVPGAITMTRRPEG